jgi:hypothetical protein
MTLPGSRLGLVLGAVYLLVGLYVVQDELRHTGGGWINLRGMGTTIVTAPSQLTLGALLRALGLPKVNFAGPGFPGYAELAAHLLLTTLVVYLVGSGLEWMARRAFS